VCFFLLEHVHFYDSTCDMHDNITDIVCAYEHSAVSSKVSVILTDNVYQLLSSLMSLPYQT